MMFTSATTPTCRTLLLLLAVVMMTETTNRCFAQEVETFDCYDASVMVTNKTTCDDWCGELGAYTGFYDSSGATNSGKQFTGLECDCTKPENKTTDELKRCEGTYTVPDCYSNGVVNKPTCDEWCLSVQNTTGASLGSVAEGQVIGLSCECTAELGADPVTEWCTSTGNPSCVDAGFDTCDNDGAACTELCDNSLVTSVCDNSTTGFVTCTCGDTLTCGAPSGAFQNLSTFMLTSSLVVSAIVTFMTLVN